MPDEGKAAKCLLRGSFSQMVVYEVTRLYVRKDYLMWSIAIFILLCLELFVNRMFYFKPVSKKFTCSDTEDKSSHLLPFNWDPSPILAFKMNRGIEFLKDMPHFSLCISNVKLRLPKDFKAVVWNKLYLLLSLFPCSCCTLRLISTKRTTVCGGKGTLNTNQTLWHYLNYFLLLWWVIWASLATTSLLSVKY